jgi:CRAL/TRIO domain
VSKAAPFDDMTAPPATNPEEVAVTATKSERHRPGGLFGSFSSSKTTPSDSEMRDAVCQMVDGLTEDEKEHAARSSYMYLWKSVKSRDGENWTPSEELLDERDLHAKAMARRFLKSKRGCLPLATQKFRDAINFRREMDVDGLRLCFQAGQLDLDEETRIRYAAYRERLEDRMTAGRVYVCGYDKQGRAIYTIYAALTRDFDPEWFLKESLYNFERALACTERESGGALDSVTVIGNYTGFQSKHSAPMSISHRFMDSLRQNYPGALPCQR